MTRLIIPRERLTEAPEREGSSSVLTTGLEADIADVPCFEDTGIPSANAFQKTKGCTGNGVSQVVTSDRTGAGRAQST